MTAEERHRIDAAIHHAESGTTARIAVTIVPDANVNAFERAKTEFISRGMHTHEHANAALILVAPKAKQFALLGDRALHERVGDDFWQETVKEMSSAFTSSSVTDAIIVGIRRLDSALHTHFGTETP